MSYDHLSKDDLLREIRRAHDLAYRMSLLGQMVEEVSLSHDEASTFHIVARYARRILGVDRCSITLLDDTGEWLDVVAVDGFDQEQTEGHRLPIAGTIMGKVIQERRLRYVEDSHTGSWAEYITLRSVGRSFMIAPLLAGGQGLGTLNVMRRDVSSFGPGDEMLLVHIAYLLATHLEERRLYDRVLRSLEHNEEILSITSHDLKNPLGAILGLSQIIAEDVAGHPNEVELRECAELIHSEAARMLTIIRDLLDRHRQGESFELHYEACDLNRLVWGALRTNGGSAQAKQITLGYDSPGPAVIWGDHTALQRVIDNLLSNAIKFSPPGRNVMLDLLLHDDGPASWEFSVQDEGPGLTPEDHAKVFGKLERLSARPTGGEHSSGLGLYVARELIEAHGGTIGVQSEAGRGARFWFRLQAYEPALVR